jgi:hypothetical protein
MFAFIGSVLIANPVYAERGCCSWHGGVSHCDSSVGRYVCSDGSYSPTCGCYYAPPAKPKPTPVQVSGATSATYSFMPQDQETFTATLDLDDANPTSYSVQLSKTAGADPGPKSDYSSPMFTFTDVTPGRWYVNVKKAVNGYWSSVYYYTVDVPTMADYLAAHPTSEPTPSVTFEPTTDQASNGSSGDGLGSVAGYGGFAVATMLAGKWIWRKIHSA